MMDSIYSTRPKGQPGSSEEDILNEPDWTKVHSHRVGFRDRDDRFPGLTHHGDEWKYELEKEAEEKEEELREKVVRGELLTVRDLMTMQEVSGTVFLSPPMP